jgi:NAD(P)-binding Rossmann-like domain
MQAQVVLLVAALFAAALNPCVHARSLTQTPSPEALATNSAAGTTTSTLSSASTSADVVIIGAGMAGITAARWIVDNTNYSAIILEARERSGGRLYSVPTAYGKKTSFSLFYFFAPTRFKLQSFSS